MKRSCGADKNQWLQKKGEEAEEAACKNDAKTLYFVLNTAEE